MDWQIDGRNTQRRADNIVVAMPGDKSISHRAVMLTSLAEGVSRIDGFLDGADTLATVAIMRQLGVHIIAHSPHSLEIHGVGLHGLREPTDVLDCGNAGTAMRLLAGLLSAQRFCTTLTGDASLRKRPMQRILHPLRLMGATISAQEGGLPPLHIEPGRDLTGIAYSPEVASAQVKSAVLLAGLYAQGLTRVEEVKPTRDYTEQMLAEMGWPISFGVGYVELQGGGALQPTHFQVPGDFSSAAFAIVAALVTPGAQVLIHNVGISPARIGLLHALRAMGADIAIQNSRSTFAGPVGDISVVYSELEAIDLPVEWVADMIDEIPVFCVAAARATGTTRIRGAEELRVKESDRIHAMAVNLVNLGVAVSEVDDGMDILGCCKLNDAVLESFEDHRIAMSLAILAGASSSQTIIRDVDNVATSFPRFAASMKPFGFGIAEA